MLFRKKITDGAERLAGVSLFDGFDAPTEVAGVGGTSVPAGVPCRGTSGRSELALGGALTAGMRAEGVPPTATDGPPAGEGGGVQPTLQSSAEGSGAGVSIH